MFTGQLDRFTYPLVLLNTALLGYLVYNQIKK
mgnify:FL=1